MRRLLLFRHGMTEANERHLYCGWSDVSLSARGVAELERLRAENLYPPLGGCRVYTSGLARTVQTLAVLYPGTDAAVCAGLRELNFGDFELKTYGDLKDVPSYQRWLEGDNERNVCPNGESGEQLRSRALAAVGRLLAESAADLALFTHGGVIAALMRHFFPGERKTRYEWQCGYGEGYELLPESPRSYRRLPFPRSVLCHCRA